MKKVDLGYSFAISLLVGLFLLPTLINTEQFEKLPVYVFVLLLFGIFPVFTIIGMIIAFSIGKKIGIAWQFAKFALVGVLNTAIDFGILNLLMAIAEVSSGLKIVPLNSISFLTAVINSFFWNKKWVFKKETGVNFITFLVVTTIGLAINNFIVYLITTHVPHAFIASDKLWANIAKAFATGIAMFWNFTGYKLIVFKKTSSNTPS